LNIFRILGNIYTGLKDGRIVKILPSGKMVDVVRTGIDLPECGMYV